MSESNVLYQTETLLAAAPKIPPTPSFLRDRYFPTNPSTDIFTTEDVLVDFLESAQLAAPVVSEAKGSIAVGEDSFKTERIKPPLVAPERTLTAHALHHRQFGENPFSGVTPMERAAAALRKDYMELDAMITRREEIIAATAMTNNSYTLTAYSDQYGNAAKGETVHVSLPEGNDVEYIPATAWDAGGDIFGDLGVMVNMLDARALPATDLIVSPDVAQAMLGNADFLKFFDLQRVNLGAIVPTELPSGASRFAVINVLGRQISVFTYGATYKNDAGALQPFIAPGTVILTAPNAGRGLYGAVTLIERERDNPVVTIPMRRVPQVVVNESNNALSCKLRSRPLFIPNAPTPWIKATVLS
jgi:hypothetical protein